MSVADEEEHIVICKFWNALRIWTTGELGLSEVVLRKVILILSTGSRIIQLQNTIEDECNSDTSVVGSQMQLLCLALLYVREWVEKLKFKVYLLESSS